MNAQTWQEFDYTHLLKAFDDQPHIDQMEDDDTTSTQLSELK